MIKYIQNADITLGRRCGYIFPIPYINMEEVEDESDIEAFINSIKNEFTSWEEVKRYWTTSEGITYSDKKIIDNEICCQN